MVTLSELYILQAKAAKLLKSDILADQTSLVNEALSRGMFNHYNILNGQSEQDSKEYKHIYNWYLVSDFLAEELKAKGEPVLTKDFGNWWGRTKNSSILMDDVIQEIAKEWYVNKSA